MIGQATIERGFSVNKQIEVENLAEESFVVKRIISDYVSYVGGIASVDVTDKQLLMAAASARLKYMVYGIWRRKNEEGDKKRKLLSDEVEQLKIKKQRLQKDYDNLEASANEIAEKAENQHSVNCIVQSNSSVCGDQQNRNWTRLRLLICSWMACCSSSRAIDGSATIEIHCKVYIL